MDYKEKLQKIVDYIKSGEKNKDNLKIGFEAEHFVVDKDTLEAISYYDDNGIATTMDKLKDEGFTAHYENDKIQSLSKKDMAITIEPAAQFEVSVGPRDTVDELCYEYKDVMKKIIPIFEAKNQVLAQVGYQPKTKIDDIKAIPKERYKYMYNYFEKYGGSMAHNMMKGTASVQAAIDFTDEEDFKKKYFVANALSPFFYSIFDNSYIFEGEVYDKHNIRQTIWENCDKSRTGIYPFSFDKDLSYEKYAKKILDTDIIFINEDGKDMFKDRIKFSEIMDDNSSKEMIYHALSIVFPDVRVKRYMEIRMPDEVPYPYNFAAVALIKGIFYDEEILNRLYDDFSDMNYTDSLNLKSRAVKSGIFAKYKDKEIYRWMIEIIDSIKEDQKYLKPLRDLLNDKKTPRDIYEKLYEESPQKAIYEFSVNKFIEDDI